MKLQRIGDGPVLAPRAHVSWEKDAVLNAAAVHADGRFHLFYRAVSHNPGDRNRSCIGHAWSDDGIHFERADEPIVQPDGSAPETKGVEDPRLTCIDGTYHLVFVSWNERQTSISLATSADLDTWIRQGVIFGPELFGSNKNACLFPRKFGGQYALIHRPMGFGAFAGDDQQPNDMWLSHSSDLRTWQGHRRLLRARRGEVEWEYAKIGLGGPPMHTEQGWLMVYHAVGHDGVYRLGLVLLDFEHPTRILKRTDRPILEPEADWELEGDVDNVVFTCGTILLGTTLWVYYGGADTVIGLAKGDVSAFLNG